MSSTFLLHAPGDRLARRQILIWQHRHELGDIVLGYEPDDVRPRDTCGSVAAGEYRPPAGMLAARQILVVVPATRLEMEELFTDVEQASRAGKHVVWFDGHAFERARGTAQALADVIDTKRFQITRDKCSLKGSLRRKHVGPKYRLEDLLDPEAEQAGPEQSI